MKKNVGLVDRIIRAAVGIGFVVLSVLVSYWFLIGAVILFMTAITKSCPIYQVLDISTCHIKEEEK